MTSIRETLSLIPFQAACPTTALRPADTHGLFAGKTYARFAAALLVVAAMLMPFQAYAMSVRQYESETSKQKGTDAGNAIDKIIADVAKVNPALSQAIHDYFYVIPPGQPESPGLIAFEGELRAVDNLAAQGKLDLDKVQIEGILLDIVKTDVMKKQPAQDKQTEKK